MFPKLLSFLTILFIIAAPFVVAAHGFPPSPIVPGCFTETDYQVRQCNFDDLLHLVKHLIDFVMFLAMPIAALVSVYAGWLYLTAGENPGNVSVAKKMFWALIIGVAWVLGAWLVIKFISDALLRPEFIAL